MSTPLHSVQSTTNVLLILRNWFAMFSKRSKALQSYRSDCTAKAVRRAGIHRNSGKESRTVSSPITSDPFPGTAAIDRREYRMSTGVSSSHVSDLWSRTDKSYLLKKNWQTTTNTAHAVDVSVFFSFNFLRQFLYIFFILLFPKTWQWQIWSQIWLVVCNGNGGPCVCWTKINAPQLPGIGQDQHNRLCKVGAISYILMNPSIQEGSDHGLSNTWSR